MQLYRKSFNKNLRYDYDSRYRRGMLQRHNRSIHSVPTNTYPGKASGKIPKEDWASPDLWSRIYVSLPKVS